MYAHVPQEGIGSSWSWLANTVWREDAARYEVSDARGAAPLPGSSGRPVPDFVIIWDKVTTWEKRT